MFLETQPAYPRLVSSADSRNMAGKHVLHPPSYLFLFMVLRPCTCGHLEHPFLHIHKAHLLEPTFQLLSDFTRFIRKATDPAEFLQPLKEGVIWRHRSVVTSQSSLGLLTLEPAAWIQLVKGLLYDLREHILEAPVGVARMNVVQFVIEPFLRRIVDQEYYIGWSLVGLDVGQVCADDEFCLREFVGKIKYPITGPRGNIENASRVVYVCPWSQLANIAHCSTKDLVEQLQAFYLFLVVRQEVR